MHDNGITKKRIVHNMAWRFSERILAQVTTFIVSVVLARKLSASDFGNVALLMVFIDIANVFVVQSFASALVQKKNVDNIDYSSVFYFSLIVSILFYVVLYLSAPLLSYVGDGNLPPMFRVLALRIPLAALNSVQQAYVQRNLLFRKFFFRTIIGTTISAFVGIYMAYAGFGAWAIVGQYLTNSLCDTLLLWLTIGWRPQRVMDFNRLKSLIGYGWKMLCSALIHVIYQRLTSFSIGTIYSAEDLAYYEQGQKIPGIIETNIDTTINSVLFPVMANEQEDIIRIKAMIRKSIQTTGCVIWPMMMGLAVLSNQVIELIYGKKWLPATVFMIIACFKLTLEPIQTANLQAVKAIGRSDLYLKMEITKKTVGILIVLIGASISVFAAAIASALQYVFASIVNGCVNKWLFKYRVSEQIFDVLLNAALSVLMALVVLVIKRFLIINILLKIVIEIVSGASVYALLVYVFNKRQFLYIKSFF